MPPPGRRPPPPRPGSLSSPRLHLRPYRLTGNLSQSPYLLVGVAGLPQWRYHVPAQVRDVAGHEARLPRRTGDDPHLPDSRRQDAALGPSKRLGSSLVLDFHRRASDVGESDEALRVGWLRVGLKKHPPLEGEVRSGAAKDAAVGAVLQGETGVRARQVVRPELVEGCLYVGVPLLFAQAVVVEVGGHHELAEVRGLLDLGDQDARTEGVEDPARHVDGVARPDCVPWHHRVVVLGLEGSKELLSRGVVLYAGQDRRTRLSPQDVPRLGLTVGLAVLPSGGLVVGVEVDGEHVRGVEELEQDREVRTTPIPSHQLVRELLHEVVERASGVLAVGDLSRGLPVVADLPSLGHDALGRVPLAEHLGDQALPEVVGANVVGQLDRIGLHRSSVPLPGITLFTSRPRWGYSTPGASFEVGRWAAWISTARPWLVSSCTSGSGGWSRWPASNRSSSTMALHAGCVRSGSGRAAASPSTCSATEGWISARPSTGECRWLGSHRPARWRLTSGSFRGRVGSGRSEEGCSSPAGSRTSASRLRGVGRSSGCTAGSPTHPPRSSRARSGGKGRTASSKRAQKCAKARCSEQTWSLRARSPPASASPAFGSRIPFATRATARSP